MSSRKIHGRMFASLAFAAIAMFCVQQTASAHVYPVGVNIAPLGTGQVSAGNPTWLNDQSSTTQTDASVNGTSGLEWSEINFGQLRSFNELIIEQCPNFVVAGYEVQVAKAGLTNPNGNSDADWETIPGGSFTGQASSSTSTRQFALGSTYNRGGIRLRTTDASNSPTGGVQRPRELWAFNNYSDLAKTATISAPGWTGTSTMNDEQTTAQDYGNINASPDVTLTWATPQDIGAVMVHGGAGVQSEHLIDFSIQYWDGAAWQNFVAPYSGNTLKTVYALPSDPVFSTQIRLHITAADYGDGNARIGEIFVFEALPEPSSAAVLLMLTVGTAATSRSRRKV